MSDTRLDGDSMDILCKALQRNSSVTLLDVSENEIGSKGEFMSDPFVFFLSEVF